MPTPISISEAQRQLSGLSKSFEKFGLTSPFRTIGKYLRKRFVSNIRRSQNPYGGKWEKTFKEPLAKVGQEAWMMTGDGQVMRQTIKSKSGKAANKRYRKEFGPPLKRNKAIHRFGEHGTKLKVAEFLDTPGKALRFSKWQLDYGFTPGTAWVEKMQFGGTYRGEKIPKRVMLELVPKDSRFINKTVDTFIDKKLKKLGR